MVIKGGEKVVLFFNGRQPFLVDTAAAKLLIKPCETTQVPLQAHLGIAGGCPLGEDKDPVACLSKKKFSQRLGQGPLCRAVRIGITRSKLSHSPGRLMEMSVNPCVCLLKPHFIIPFPPPGRKVKGALMHRWGIPQGLARGR